jgi:hypothetical protein
VGEHTVGESIRWVREHTVGESIRWERAGVQVEVIGNEKCRNYRRQD